MAFMTRAEHFFGGLLARCERHPALTTAFFFAFTLAVRYGFAFAAWGFFGFPFQRYDPYMYVVKGLEIAAGDFSPIRTHGLGWPVVLGAVFRFWHGSSVFENLAISSTVATFFSALALFPLLYLMKKIDTHPRTFFLLLVLFSTSFLLTLPENDSIAMADPLFTFLFLVSLCFLYAARGHEPFLAVS